MNPGRKRWLLRAAIVAVGGLALFVWFAGQRERLAVENRSGQKIAELRVTVAGQTATFKNVDVGARVVTPFPANDSTPVDVGGKLADGKQLHGWFARAGEPIHLVVGPDGTIAPRKSGKS